MPKPTSNIGPAKKQGTSNGFMASGKKPAPKLGKTKVPAVGSNAALQANWKV
jgi:hypothetical protein